MNFSFEPTPTETRRFAILSGKIEVAAFLLPQVFLMPRPLGLKRAAPTFFGRVALRDYRHDALIRVTPNLNVC